MFTKFKRLTSLLVLAGLALGGLFLSTRPSVSQETVYPGNTYHGPFVAGNSYSALQYLGPAFELPQVLPGTAGYIEWTKGAVYPDGVIAPTVSTVLAQGQQATVNYSATSNTQTVTPGFQAAYVTYGGIQVQQSGPSGAALGSSLNNCNLPSFSSCDIAIVPYYSVSGSVASGTFQAGETVTQATSSATAVLLAVPGSTMYLSAIASGTLTDATDTWTGTTSGATYTPTTAPSNSNGEPVLITTNLDVAKAYGVTPIAFIQTNSSSVPTSITYPYQLISGGIPHPQSTFVGFCSGTVSSNSVDYVFPLGGVAVACSSDTSATVGAPVGSAGVLANLTVKDGTAPGGSLTGVWTVLKNGTGTVITCTITGTATTCSDTSHFVSVKAGDLITIKDATGTSSAEAAPTVTLEKY